MRVQRQVIRGEGDVGVEQQFETALQRGVDRLEPAAPEEAVVNQQQLHALGGRQLEQLRVRRYAARDGADRARPGDLQTVGAVVLEALAAQQTIELLEDFGDRGGHR